MIPVRRLSVSLPLVLLASSYAHAQDIVPFDAYYQAKPVQLVTPANIGDFLNKN